MLRAMAMITLRRINLRTNMSTLSRLGGVGTCVTGKTFCVEYSTVETSGAAASTRSCVWNHVPKPPEKDSVVRQDDAETHEEGAAGFPKSRILLFPVPAAESDHQHSQ